MSETYRVDMEYYAPGVARQLFLGLSWRICEELFPEVLESVKE